MVGVRVVIVSDSALLSSALEQSIRSSFETVEKTSSISRIASRKDNWATMVAIIDAGNPQIVVKELLSAREEIDLTRTIILMRGNQSILDFRNLIGLVGAILPDGSGIDEIALIARIIRQGITLLPSNALSFLTDHIADMVTEVDEVDVTSFTEREENVLMHISEGASNKIIARKLVISESTVRVHVRSILKKLGLQNRTQAALYAVNRKVAPSTRSKEVRLISSFA